ncbi:hypothetical protein [Arthrobacter sp. CDRTa11]|nr:hypothetical protein [Arthrobacter sp. CDRTa11]
MPFFPPGIITQTVETYRDRFDLVLLGDAEALRVDGTYQRVIPSP